MTGIRRTIGAVLGVIALLAIYLFLWPVPIDPVAWDAPVNRGLVDPFETNNRLARARTIDLGIHEGPEDIAGGPDGLIYATSSDGNIIRFRTNGTNVEVFANVGGRPLGLEFDNHGNLLIANAYLGLQRVTPDGTIEILADAYEGKPISYADDVAVAADGSIYFSDASSKFGAREFGGAYAASLLDIMEHGAHGRIFRFDPATNVISVVVDGLNFANGVAVSDDQQSLIIVETGSYRILRHWLAGDRAGNTEVIIDNLPGFPDNITNGRNGKFWIGFIAPRVSLLDDISVAPWLRKLVQRLPAFLQPKAVPSSHVIAINGDGDVLMNLQDTAASLPALTGVYETDDALWLTSLFGNRTARLDKRNLANP
jgi:sugar lactone lactonase YvrE